MPDVGVLQLRISADASNASRSLKTLQTRLSEINQIAQTFNLSNVATQIGNIVKQVSSDKATSTAVKNLGSLLNAISAFSKVTKLGLNKSQIEQISALQSAVSGFNLGQSGTQLNKLREALGGEWNTDQASKVRDALVTMSGGAKTLTDSGTANTIKETAKAVEQMSSGTANEIKTASAEMENFGQTTGNTANILDRLGSLQSSIFGRIPSHYMSMQGSVLNETAGFAESERQIKEVSVVAKDATTDMQNLKSASEETASSIENIDISRMVQEVEQAATYMALADKDVASGIDEANSRLEEQIRLRREALEAENQARLENNYQNYRELFLSKEGEWEQQVPEMYGFTPKALEEGETYADAMKITMQEVNEYVDQFIDKMNTPSGPLLKDSIDDMLGIGRAAKSAEESAKALQYAPEIKEATQEVQTAVAGMANSMTKSQTATRVLGDNLKDLDGELKEKKSDINDVTNETKSMTARFSELMVGSEGLGGSFKRMFPAISGLLGRFKQLVKYRMLRAIIRQIAKAFKEGTENYYHYSQAIGGTFAPAMDNATSALLQMKNSIGAAAAPVIQALIPYLQMAVNWFITAINYANQFFALLGGQTSWSRAVPQTAKAFDNVKKSAGGASAAMKDLLADWDELNIIQSESGGGGGGGGAAAMEDYLNMFEESSIFDDKIKGIVSFVKDNFDEILDIVKQIGAALLLWKVSSALGGILGTLAGLTAAGLTAALVFEVSTLFTNEYLKTGDVGWLIADILSTAIGAFFGKKILDKVLGGAGGEIFIPLAFALSATASIIALVEDTNVDAFSEKGLLTALTAALEGGVAAGYLAHIVGGTLGESLLGGVVGTIGTFGIAIALKADAKVSAEGITPDTVKQQLVGIGSLGVAGAIAGAKLGAKFGVGAAAGAAGLSMLFMGLPIATFGVSVGLHAINTSVDMGGITPEVIRENITAAALVGTGLTLGTVALAGGTVAALVGIGGAAVTLAALFGIEAILSEEHMTIDWGDKDLTTKQVREFVENEVFTVNPNTILSLIDPAIEVVTTSEAGLQASVDEVKITAKKVTFGINEDESLKELEKQIFGDEVSGTKGLIDTFKDTAKDKQTLIETGFALVPTVDENGNVTNLVDESSEVWSMLTGHMDDLGRKLSSSLFNAYNEQLTQDERDAELKTIAQLTQMMANVSEAIIKGEEWELAMQEFEGNLSNLSKGSWMSIIDYIDDYKNDIREATEKAYDEVTRQMAGQVRGLRASMNNALELAGGDENDTAYQQYKQEYEYWNTVLEGRRAGRKDAIDREMAEAMDDDTIAEMRRIILEKIEGTATEMDFREGFRRAGIDTGMDGAIDQFFAGLFDESGQAVTGAQTKYKAFLSGLIENAFGEDSDAVLALMDLGILQLADIIPKELMSSMAENILQNGGDPALVDAMMRFMNGDFKEGSIREAAATGNEIAETIKSEYLSALQRGVQEDSAEMDRILGELAGQYGAKAVEDVMVELNPEVQVKDTVVEQVAETKQIVMEALREALTTGMDDSQFDALQGDLGGRYGFDLVDAVLSELESEMFDTEMPEMNVTQPVALDIETEEVTSDISDAVNRELQNASGSGGGGNGYSGVRDYYANMGASVMQGINATFANMKNILPWMSGSSDITITETRDSGEEIGNTAEGTRQGTSEIVTGQNTMNGYMQQVATSTAGMAESQGTANSYMAQMVSLLRTIASQGGGAAPAAQSVMGGMVAGALAAFEAVKG